MCVREHSPVQRESLKEDSEVEGHPRVDFVMFWGVGVILHPSVAVCCELKGGSQWGSFILALDSEVCWLRRPSVPHASEGRLSGLSFKYGARVASVRMLTPECHPGTQRSKLL